MTRCSRVKIHWRFGLEYYFYFQGRKVSQVSNQQKALFGLIFHPEVWGNTFLWNVGELYRSAWRHVSEHSTLHSNSCESLRSVTDYIYIG